MSWKLSMAVLVFALGCASAPTRLPDGPTESKPEPQPQPRLTIEQVKARCKQHNITCVDTYIEGRFVLIGHFPKTRDLESQIVNVTRDAGVPFCVQNNQYGIAARFYAHVIYAWSRYLDCQTGNITEWVKDPPPGPIPSHLRTFGEICAYVEKDDARPFRCKIEDNNGMSTLALSSVVSVEDTAPYLKDIDDNLALPYCTEARRLGVGALVELKFPMDNRGYRWNCDNLQATPKPFYLTPPARTSAPAPQYQQQHSGTTTL